MKKDDLGGLIRYVSILPELSPSAKSKVLSWRGRLSKLESDQSVGILSQEEYSKERNQIRYALLQFVSELENKIEKNEKRKHKRTLLIKNSKQYLLYLGLTLIVGLIAYKIYSFYSYRNSMSIPGRFVGKEINPKNIDALYNYLQEDTTAGTVEFRDNIRELYAISKGKETYIGMLNLDTSYWNTALVADEKFKEIAEGFYVKLAEKEITVDRLYKEYSFIEELREGELKDSILLRFAKVDEYCKEVQSVIDEKNELARRIQSEIDLSLENIRINRSDRSFCTKVTVRSGLGEDIYYLKTMHYAVETITGDTITQFSSRVDNNDGIRTYYVNPEYYNCWDQEYIYNSLKDYKRGKVYFLQKIEEANINGEVFNFFRGYRPTNLPYDAHYEQNQYYKTPEELEGKCPYLYSWTGVIGELNTEIIELIKEKRKAAGYEYLDMYDELDFRVE